MSSLFNNDRVERFSFKLVLRALKTWTFWRNQAVYFAFFSLFGHWMEIVYCSIMDSAFGIVADDSLVWDDPMYPFCVYGVAVLVCTIVLLPIKNWYVQKFKTRAGAIISFFFLAVFASMVMELVMGLLLNQPDPATGIYPLWDNSVLPGNILGQAWIVNDIGLGLLISLYIWVILPFTESIIERVPQRTMDIFSVLFVGWFIWLCVVKFS